MAPSDEKDASAKPWLFSSSSNHEGSSVAVFEKDLAAAIVSDRAQGFDRATEQRVVRKIDGVLIPWMWLGYGFVYYDKVRKRERRRGEGGRGKWGGEAT